jgi:hypothetical protein
MRILNRTKALLILTLNSGVTLHLAPGQRSAPVDAREIADRDKIEKLLKNGMITFVSGDGGVSAL